MYTIKVTSPRALQRAYGCKGFARCLIESIEAFVEMS